MWIVRGTLTALVVAALAPAAHAWTGLQDGLLKGGPALTSTGTAWVEGRSADESRVMVAPLDGPPRTLFTLPVDSCGSGHVTDMDAAGDHVGVMVRRSAPDSACPQRTDLFVADGLGGSKILATSGTDFSSCAIDSFDLDGNTAAVGRYNCHEAPVMLYDVATGAATPLPLTLEPGQNPLKLRMAGRYVAVLLENFTAHRRLEIVVWDREAGAVAYRADPEPLRNGADYAIGSHQLELQADGRVLYGITTTAGGFGVRYGWASPAAPVMTPIPGTYIETRGRIGFAGDLIAVGRDWSSNGTVVALDGTPKNNFAGKPSMGSLAFDGTRLAWVTDRLVHNEAFPFHPPADAPPVTPPPAPPPNAAHPPTAQIGAIKARGLKAFTGTATDPDGDVLLVRVGLVRVAKRRCETLRASGRLARVKPSAGRCVPTTWLDAAGTTSWKLRLRKRLPAGRYELYVQAVDAGGRAQVTFTKAAGNLRSFRVKK